MLTRTFGKNFEVSDWTEELVLIQNQWGRLAGDGLFQEEGIETYTVQFEQTTKDGAILVDKVRGERADAGKEQGSLIRAWSVPHFPYDDYITPSDIKGKRAYGSASDEEQLAFVRARRLARIRQNHAWTLEYARWKALTSGDVYAPNGTVSMNYFTEFGVSQKAVNFVLGTGTTDIIAKIEEGIAHIQDNASGQNISGIVCYCSSGFFSSLIGHANVKTAYTYYTSTQEPLRQRQGGNTTMYREFFHGGVLFVEVRGNYAGSAFIPANEAVMVPVGTDAFKTYFASANKFDLLGSTGEQAYVFEYPGERGDKIVLESESNFLNALCRPAMVVKVTAS